jgi:hypothetical protein
MNDPLALLREDGAGDRCWPSGKQPPEECRRNHAPRSCATMKPGTSAGRMPANVSVSAQATVTAGLANDF